MDITLPYRIFAVDPATTKSGWAMLELLSLNPLQIRVVKHGQIDGQKLLRQKKEMSSLFSKQFCVIDALEDEYIQLIREFNPHQVVSEGAFAYVHVSAALALTLAIHALRRASKIVLNQDIVIVPPTITKLAFAGKGNADKNDMRSAYLDADYLIRDSSNEEISEHEIDAAAHGCGYVARDITGTVIQISAADKKKQKRDKQKEKEKQG